MGWPLKSNSTWFLGRLSMITRLNQELMLLDDCRNTGCWSKTLSFPCVSLLVHSRLVHSPHQATKFTQKKQAWRLNAVVVLRAMNFKNILTRTWGMRYTSHVTRHTWKVWYMFGRKCLLCQMELLLWRKIFSFAESMRLMHFAFLRSFCDFLFLFFFVSFPFPSFLLSSSREYWFYKYNVVHQFL